MVRLFHDIATLLSSNWFMLSIISTAFIFKTIILGQLIIQGLKNPTRQRAWLYLICAVLGALIDDTAWIIKLMRLLFWPELDYRFLVCLLRIAWAFCMIQYQSIALFIENLLEQKSHLHRHQKIFIGISSCFVFFFVGIACIYFNYALPDQRPWYEFKILELMSTYAVCLLLPYSLVRCVIKVRSNTLPRILTQQLKIFTWALLVPRLVSDFIQIYPLGFTANYVTNNYTFVSISTILFTIAIYYCSQKMVGLRFMNFQTHVQSSTWFNFIDDFKIVIDQLSHSTSVNELRHITQMFFKDTFNIPLHKTTLYIRSTADASDTDSGKIELNITEKNVENFIGVTHDGIDAIMIPLKQTRILINDEVAFNNFYEEDKINAAFLDFLQTINADIFLPLYAKQTIVGYIIVEKNVRPKDFFTDIERDEMLVFSNYLGNIINLLQHRNLDKLIAKEKKLFEELHIKHQEINQYKESIHSFLRTSKEKEIGIIFYKNRRFVFGNRAAKELINFNINTQIGHPLVKDLKRISEQVQAYKSPQTCFTTNNDGHKLIIAGIPNLEHNNVIITLYYPEISDIIRKKINLLKDPSQWDYLLYMETTQAGRLINQLIPGSGEQLLAFKIALLKASLSKSVIMLDVADEDIKATVEIIHHMSLREVLHFLTLKSPVRGSETAIKLFGINPIFDQQHATQPLLERLNNTGTLFIKNIHYLDLESQQYLAEYLRYGYYRIFKSDQKVTSNVRIICSTTQDLALLVKQGTFSAELYAELKNNIVVMPSINSLPQEELSELAEGFSQQAIKSQDLKNLLELNDKDKEKISNSKPSSLHELKIKVQNLLINKSKKNHIFQETQFNPTYAITDPELIHIAHLGKHALRDPKIMSLLWNKFNKSQNKIASFLNVNRSSVNRRCKEYNLE